MNVEWQNFINKISLLANKLLLTTSSNFPVFSIDFTQHSQLANGDRLGENHFSSKIISFVFTKLKAILRKLNFSSLHSSLRLNQIIFSGNMK